MDAIPDEEFIDLVEVIVWGIEKGKFTILAERLRPQ